MCEKRVDSWSIFRHHVQITFVQDVMKFQGEKFMLKSSRSVSIAPAVGQNYLQQHSIIYIQVQIAFSIKNMDKI